MKQGKLWAPIVGHPMVQRCWGQCWSCCCMFPSLRWHGCVTLWRDACMYVYRSLAACLEIHTRQQQPWFELWGGAFWKARACLHCRKEAAPCTPRCALGEQKGWGTSACASEFVLKLPGTSLCWGLWCACVVRGVHQESVRIFLFPYCTFKTGYFN